MSGGKLKWSDSKYVFKWYYCKERNNQLSLNLNKKHAFYYYRIIFCKLIKENTGKISLLIQPGCPFVPPFSSVKHKGYLGCLSSGYGYQVLEFLQAMLILNQENWKWHITVALPLWHHVLIVLCLSIHSSLRVCSVKPTPPQPTNMYQYFQVISYNNNIVEVTGIVVKQLFQHPEAKSCI